MSLVISAWEKAERENQELRNEIERLQMELRAEKQDHGAVVAGLQGEIERLRGELHSVHAHLQHMREETARLRAALLSADCPGGGWNGMPKDRPATVALCVEHGVCGCTLGRALEAT